ncbi:MAG: two-component sensor histidine kinase [Deltaproteobacteria bacterium]|nr:two-component sensor histidine kinase [Deltaproteobacteria bacterium]
MMPGCCIFFCGTIFANLFFMILDPEKNSPVLKSVMRLLCGGSFLISRQLTIEWVGSVSRRWSGGRETEDLEGRHCYAVIMKKRKPCANCPVLRAYATGKTEQLEIKVGKERFNTEYYMLTASPVPDRGGRSFEGVVEVIRDVTAFRRAEEDLKELGEFSYEIVENAPVAIFTIDKKGEFSSVNPALAKLAGFDTVAKAKEKLIGFNWIKNPYTKKCGMAQHIKDGLRGKPFQLWDFPFINYWGVPQYIYFTGVPIKDKDGKVERLLCIIEETTDRVKANDQLMQEAKMSIVGRLTTGIAHELNNPLATITANAELALDTLENLEGKLPGSDLEEFKESLKIIEEQAFRCTRTIKTLLDVTRKKELGTTSIDINQLVDEILDHINFRNLPVRFIEDLPMQLPGVKGDFDAMRQVFMNIIVNAVDAVEGIANASIWLKAREAPDDMIEVLIEDNGPGIPENIRSLIFEPFFTTKGIKKGTGLGLTLCYDFLQRMGGSIEVNARFNGGCIFKVLLPRYARQYRGKEDTP